MISQMTIIVDTVNAAHIKMDIQVLKIVRAVIRSKRSIVIDCGSPGPRVCGWVLWLGG